MKKVIASLLIALLLPLPVMSQGIGAQVMAPRIRILRLVGKGVAISQEDPMDFLVVKGAIGTVVVRWMDEERELTVGVMYADNERYRLKNIEIGNETISADIYKEEENVGNLDISRIEKNDTVVWVGVLTLNGKDYNVYILGVRRPFRPLEVKEKVVNYCEKNPSDPKCEKVGSYCKENPSDRRCRQILVSYCSKHLGDERCRKVVKDWCKEHPNAPGCKVVRTVRKSVKKLCTEHPNAIVCRKLKVKPSVVIGIGQTTMPTIVEQTQETTTTVSE